MCNLIHTVTMIVYSSECYPVRTDIRETSEEGPQSEASPLLASASELANEINPVTKVVAKVITCLILDQFLQTCYQ
jgi:hypothetical protein